MAKLLLVKHAPPRIDPAVPSPRWTLSDEGRGRCGWLADQLRMHDVLRLYCSLEPKALETAALVGVRLGLEVSPRTDLHENDRSGLGFVSTQALNERIRRFFAEPTVCVMGTESALAAGQRFEGAVRGILSRSGTANAAVISHGTVLTTLVAAHTARAPFGFWASLGLPSVVVVDAQSLKLQAPALTCPDAATAG
jgi:broad specificity phosphatase PhoE